MKFLCHIVGHDWSGCKCSRCEERRPHDWKSWEYEGRGSCQMIRTCRRCPAHETVISHQLGDKSEWPLEDSAACARCGMQLATCSSCSGTGVIPCASCGGTGAYIIEGEVAQWGDYSGSGLMSKAPDYSSPCPVCDGRGQGPCSRCDGSGKSKG